MQYLVTISQLTSARYLNIFSSKKFTKKLTNVSLGTSWLSGKVLKYYLRYEYLMQIPVQVMSACRKILKENCAVWVQLAENLDSRSHTLVNQPH